jgi:hypothetical protein
MQSGRRVRRAVVAMGLVIALPVFGQLPVSAATSPTVKPSARPAASSHVARFHVLTHRPSAVSGARTLKRAGSFGLTVRRGSAAARYAVLGSRSHVRTALGSSAAAPKWRATIPASATLPPDALTQFPGISQAQTISQGSIAPPDTNMAAGPTVVLETVNSTLYAFDRSGSVLASIDLNIFMNVTPGYSITDPRVIYDPGSQRFWLTTSEAPNSGCPAAVPVLIAVSASSNPLPFTSWLVYALPFAFSGAFIGDQPGLGISTNTLAVTFGEFGCSNTFIGSDVHILQKTDYEHNSGKVSDVYFADPQFAPQPVQSLGSITTQYVVDNQSDCGPTACTNPAIAVDAFQGTPEPIGNVTVVETRPAMTPTAVSNTTPYYLPGAEQMGTTRALLTDDDRFQNAVWENGKLWTAGGTQCTPAGDTTTRACLDYVGVTASSTGTVNLTVTQLNNVGINGRYLFYPAVSVDASGNVVTVFDESSSTAFPSIVDAAIPAGTSTLSSFQTLHSSSTFYDPGAINPNACQVVGTIVECRWGDYSGAAQDPLNPKDVWVVSESEDQTTTANCTANDCWNSDISLVTLAAPIITSLSPPVGPVAGGQTVTVNGFDFGLDTTATFGGSPITITPGSLTPSSFAFVTAPSGAAGGTDQVQATDALGATVPNAASLYTYVGLANYVPLAPFRVLDTRPAALGPGAVMTLQVTGVGITPVPSTATAVVVNVTEINDSTASLLTVYPYLTSRPNASNLNFLAHTVIANLVTVILGSGGKINIYNALGSVNVAVDVEGYFTPPPAPDPTGLFHPVPPVRVCDTRPQSPTPICSAHGALGPQALMVVNFATTGGLPGDGTAEAVVVNLTGVAASAATYLSLFPTKSDGTCHPTGTSNINLVPGAVQANRVMVALGPSTTGGPNDALCVYNPAGTINVLIDANGWYGSSSAIASGYQYQAVAPTRICDTRLGSTPCTQGAIGAGVSRLTPVAGAMGIPAAGSATTVVAVIANLTAVVPTAATYLTLYPANLTTRPQASDLNVNAGVTLPNLVVVQLDTITGKVYLYNGAGSVNAIIDIEGWFQ